MPPSRELEEKILPPADRTPIDRYLTVAPPRCLRSFKTLAAEYQYKIDETVPLNVHIEKLKEQILSHVEKIMGIDY